MSEAENRAGSIELEPTDSVDVESTSDEEIVEDLAVDVLVEEISIDGMCGVY